MIVAAKIDDIEFFCRRVGYSPSKDAKGVVFRDDGIKAMVLYDHWAPNSVNVHVYSSGPDSLFHPEFVRAMFSYPFEQCGKGVLLAVTPANAKESLAVSKALGFRETYRVKDGWEPGVDFVVKEMTRDECKWLKKEAA